MLCSLCVKWGEFDTTGLACGLDSAFAEVTPIAGAALYHRVLVELWQTLATERKEQEFTPATPATFVRGKPGHLCTQTSF